MHSNKSRDLIVKDHPKLGDAEDPIVIGLG